MKKIKCEICNGEICRMDGKYTCTKCGCLYSADDLKAMLQTNTDKLPYAAQMGYSNTSDLPETNLSEKPGPPNKKGRVWLIIAVVAAILLVSLAQVWVNVLSDATDSDSGEVRSVQEIIDSAAQADSAIENSSSGD